MVRPMPETKTRRRPAAKKPAAAKKSAVASKAPARKAAVKAPSRRKPKARTAAERTTDLSDELIKELEDGAQNALEAVRRFLGTVEEALPTGGRDASRGQEISDAAMEMAKRLVHTQSEFLRRVVDSAGKSVSRSGRKR